MNFCIQYENKMLFVETVAVLRSNRCFLGSPTFFFFFWTMSQFKWKLYCPNCRCHPQCKTYAVWREF